VDLWLFKNRSFTADPDAVFDGDGIVNAVDLGIFKQYFTQPPSPSGIAPQPLRLPNRKRKVDCQDRNRNHTTIQWLRFLNWQLGRLLRIKSGSELALVATLFRCKPHE
jgi:hypothetical protein